MRLLKITLAKSYLNFVITAFIFSPSASLDSKQQEIMNTANNEVTLLNKIRGHLNTRLELEKMKKNEDLLFWIRMEGAYLSSENTFQGDENQESLNSNLRKRRSVDKANTSAPTLSRWQEWTPCNTSNCLQMGVQERSRRCVVSGEPSDDQLLCQAALKERRNCSVPCNFTLYNNTNSTPDEMTMENNIPEEMTTGKIAMEGSAEPTVLYSSRLSPAVSGWGNWSEWERCSVTCAQGSQSRRRQCLSDQSQNCAGTATETRNCQEMVRCPTWRTWGQWSDCSVSCGSGGFRYKQRDCAINRELTAVLSVETNEILKQTTSQQTEEPDNSFEVVNSSLCHGGSDFAEMSEPCNGQITCQRRWSPWREWSRCSTTCGIGFRSTRRECLRGNGDGSECQGNSVKFRRCYSPPCWTPWSKFSRCSVSCGGTGGIRTRVRECVGTSDSMEACFGEQMQTEMCNSESCPMWGPWTRFSRCTKTCNSGTKVRRRQCLSGNCQGASREVIPCNYQACETWGSWGAFSCCSTTCGNNGYKERTRICRNRNFGLLRGRCSGPRRQRVQCSLHPCNETLPSVFNSFQCGIRNERKTSRHSVLRIFGGQESKRHGWPWQGSWQHRACYYCDWIHFCGATLVAPQWVVTAGHCTEESAYRVNHNDPGNSWSIVLGMHRLYEDGQRHFLSRVFVHAHYDFDDVTVADIALLKLRRPAVLSTEISPVCLPHLLRPTPGENCYITGWGYTASPTNTNAQLSIELLEASVPIMTFSDCQRLGRNYRQYLNSVQHMCAGDPVSAERDSCTGDSGGPLVCSRGENQWYFAGVTSFGFTDCGSVGHVGIYAPVSTYQRWIRTTVESYSREVC